MRILYSEVTVVTQGVTDHSKYFLDKFVLAYRNNYLRRVRKTQITHANIWNSRTLNIIVVYSMSKIKVHRKSKVVKIIKSHKGSTSPGRCGSLESLACSRNVLTVVFVYNCNKMSDTAGKVDAYDCRVSYNYACVVCRALQLRLCRSAMSQRARSKRSALS